jgi:anti-sigma factor RsiW
MRCDEVRELLALYAGGEGPDEDRPGVEAHVALCAGCARELDEVRELRSVLGSLGDAPMPAPASKALWSAVRREFFPRPAWRAELLRLAAVLLLGVGLGAAAYVAVPAGGSPVRIAAPVHRLDALPAVAPRLAPARAVEERHHLPRVEAVLTSGEREF